MRINIKYSLKQHPATLILSGVLVLVIALVMTGFTFSQSSAAQAESVQTTMPDSACLACHAQEGMTIELKNGETLPLTIDQPAFSASVHGKSGITCTTCHENITGFPHPRKTADSLRGWALENYPTCQKCHSENFAKEQDSVHQTALNAGNYNAAVCADCHNPHTQKPVAEARLTDIPDTCSQCHSAIAAEYKASVHGLNLYGGNRDVPTCISCHGVHNIQDPRTNEFRLKSPTEMCGRCHTDGNIMDKYGISTKVLETYVSDFHGTTVVIFEKQSPDQITNKPVCFDCHGVHDIRRTDDPKKGLQVKENILVTCQKCHPDATDETFADSWLGHYIPDPQHNPIVYYVNLFYKFFIPAVLGPMIIFVISDFFRRRKDNKAGKAH